MPLYRPLNQLFDRFRHATDAHLLMAAAMLHVSLSALINLMGRFHLAYGMFDENGISGAFAFDCFYYRRKSIELVEALIEGRFSDWFFAAYPFHVKLYSLSFTLLHPIFGYTMLGVEPLNLLYYLSIVILIFKLGREIFERRAALLAATLVALWPSFLLHTTQLLRDPLFIIALLLLLLIITRWLTRELSFRRALVEAFAGAAAGAIIWLTRYNMWWPLFVFVALALILLIIRQRRKRQWLAANMACAALLLLMLASVPLTVGKLLRPDSTLVDPAFVLQPAPPTPPCLEQSASQAEAAANAAETQKNLWSRLLARADRAVAHLGELRRRFAIFYPDAGSNIDACVRLRSVSDLARFLPRAVAHGLLAPYPSMWLSVGSSVGRAGRILSGLETLVMYFIELLAIFGLWHNRRNPRVWLIFLIAMAGIISISLAVVNIAVLFRLRYPFWMLLVVLGAGATVKLLPGWKTAQPANP